MMTFPARIRDFFVKLVAKFKSLSLKKKLLVITVFIIVFFVILSSVSSASKPSPYTMAKATNTTIVETVSETGNITANGSTEVFSPTNGIVEDITVANGDSVIEGQELFTIRSSATEQEQAQALAAYLAAKTTLDTANATLPALQAAMFSEWDVYKEMAESDSYENADGSPKYDQRSVAEYHVAEKSWQAAEGNYKKQQAVIAQAQVAVQSANLLYQATQNAIVKSPIAGTISNLSITIGNTVSAQTPTVPVTPLATVANLTTTEVAVSLSENDIAKVRDGQRATVDISSVDEKNYTGIVRRVDSMGTNNQGVIRYNAYIEVVNADDKLRPGMTADAEIITLELQDVLSVPSAAVKPYQGGRAVRIIDPKTKELKFIPVEIGIRGSDKTQIIKGINEGQEVVTALSNDQLKRPGLF